MMRHDSGKVKPERTRQDERWNPTSGATKDGNGPHVFDTHDGYGEKGISSLPSQTGLQTGMGTALLEHGVAEFNGQDGNHCLLPILGHGGEDFLLGPEGGAVEVGSLVGTRHGERQLSKRGWGHDCASLSAFRHYQTPGMRRLVRAMYCS